jgi:UPF0755 protein
VTYVDERRWNTDEWDQVETFVASVVEQPRTERSRIKWFTWVLIYLGMAGVVAAGLTGLWYTEQVNPLGDAGDPVSFTVNEDDTLETIGARLEEAGLIASADVFRWYVDHHGGLALTPGYYQLRASDHMGNIVQVLRTPPSETFTKVTFPEGFTIERMALRLEEKVPRLSALEFEGATTDGIVRSAYQPDGVTSLEGMLFPDTYQISNGESEAEVVRRMVRLMERVGSQLTIEERAARLGMTPYQILIIASIIEREARLPEDRPKIARVIYNRLYVGVPLQIDATLLYRQPVGSSPTALREVDTPYNTYMHSGLPPTPIANPGRASIEAALSPSPNPSLGDPLCLALPPGTACVYLFYVLATEEGGHAFAVTLEQHNANVEAARAKGLL